MSIRMEVKYQGGRFTAYGKEADPNMRPVEAARYYVTHISKADYILVPGVQRRKSVEVLGFTKEQVLAALDELEGKEDYGVLSVVQGQVKVMRVEFIPVVHTFGKPALQYSSSLRRLADLKPDKGCDNAPKARAWEKVCAKAVGGKWVGALKGVQVDIIVNEADD